MLFVRHASTPGMRTACFPGADEDADAASLARAHSLASVVAGSVVAGSVVAGSVVAGSVVPGSAVAGVGSAWVAPSAAARQTAAALGREACVVAALAEADHGRWRGLPYGRVAQEEPDALASWLADPDAAPHGGESLTVLAARMADWLDSGRGEPEAVAVCDAGAIRAALGHALGLDPLRAARFDLAPLSVTELTVTRGGWRVAHVNRKILS
ncbi:histidine phosphatase family protein [Nonomuraea aurantiaca]|uniref:histidine phosphatase family protein n=1 Tax=Nonomuraea aurantiaca TaxID=2878562 RepID=UPI0027E08052|nr:histidine phosphatase family protein [Nonomuraea aurantiaca]